MQTEPVDADSGSSSVALLKEVTAHMRANGVRRVRMARGSLELEVELDPAAQLLNQPEPEGPSEQELEAKREEKRAAGLCIVDGCEGKGGHMGQPTCRKCFLAEVNGAQKT